MEGLSNIFTNQIEKVFLTQKPSKKIVVAVSGGADSLALTFLLQEFCQAKKITLIAVTIDHKMRTSSSLEAKKLGLILKKAGITHHILSLNDRKIPTKNIEATLRESRYELLYEFCLKQRSKFLFLGHQLEDVAENFLIRLFRGSGLDGLSAIASISDHKKIKVVRPLLEAKKSDLKNFLATKKIKWFEDESNSDEKFLRNKIRNFLATFEEHDLICQRIKNAADEIAKTRDFFDELMLDEAAQILRFEESYFLIDRKKLCQTQRKIALKILALAAMEIAQKNYKPRLKDLTSFYEYLCSDQKIKRRDFYGCYVTTLDKKWLKLVAQKPTPEFYFRTILKERF